jgi:hypothetical protein
MRRHHQPVLEDNFVVLQDFNDVGANGPVSRGAERHDFNNVAREERRLRWLDFREQVGPLARVSRRRRQKGRPEERDRTEHARHVSIMPEGSRRTGVGPW